MYPYCSHISHSSLFIKKLPLIKKDLLFNESLKYIGDYEWIVRIIKLNIEIGKLNNDLSLIRIHDQQTSKKSFYKMREEQFALQKKTGVSYFKASFFRKISFFINLINSIRINGFREALSIITDRLRRIFS